MGHRADQFLCGVAWELRVGIQVMTYLTPERTAVSRYQKVGNRDTTIPRSSIQIGKLPAFSFCQSGVLRIQPRAVKQKERIPFTLAILCVELLDSRFCQLEQWPSSAIDSVPHRENPSKRKCRFLSRLARNRTSRASTRASIFSALANIVGITVSVRDSGGMPWKNPFVEANRGNPQRCNPIDNPGGELADGKRCNSEQHDHATMQASGNRDP
jgi:hypothetical protein